MTHPSPEILLFDLGAVLIDISFDRVFANWGERAGVTVSSLRSRFSQDEPYKAHERGEISGSVYWASLRETLGLDLTDVQFEQGWNEIFISEIPAVTGLLEQLNLPLFVFSNTNRTHQDYFEREYAEALKSFERVFTSNELGRRKPEPDAFHQIATETGVPLEAILFFDDSPVNIEGANQVGMQTCHVKDPANIGAELRSRNLL